MRKHIAAVTVLALLAAGAVVEAQDDEQAVREVAQRWADAWNAGDLASVAQLYREDADFVDIFGESHAGKSAVEAYLNELHQGAYKGAVISVAVTATRFVNPAIAVLDGTWEMSGMSASGEAPPAKGLYTVISTKDDGGWRIASHRARVPAAPPSEGE